jgi:hypothetical protein
MVKTMGQRRTGSLVSKTIGAINQKTGILQQPIMYSEVGPLLESIGEERAGDLLQELLQKAQKVRDPTSWLKSAVTRVQGVQGGVRPAGGRQGNTSGMMGVSATPSFAASGAPRAVQCNPLLSKAIGMLNHQDILQQPINFREAAPWLSSVPESRAVELITQLAEKAAQVKDPTNWLIAAAKKASASTGQAGRTSGSPVGGHPYIAKAIGMLNAEGALQQPIKFREAAPYMSSVPESLAIELIKQLAEKAAEVKDPTNWLIAAAKKAASTGRRPSGSVVSKIVGELNQKGVLSSPVMWSTVCGPLLLIPEEEAGGLVKQLEQNAADVRDPTNWLLRAGDKALKQYTRGAKPDQQDITMKDLE